MKHMLNLYILGVVLALLSIFIGLMESLGVLLEGPLSGNSWTTRGQLAHPETPKGLPDHPSQSRLCNFSCWEMVMIPPIP
ncbi:PREDICTED: hypoxia-inducible lipid droplet-associated protein [Chrysochloris asiatica]|uniref:Hypoxia-inducible lipid droplet-associated protein n=1 Tax=Chrysochloris asiatica TaxID=185453 RepID=A0A9B0TH67_CHRAS|nr:PREDICTED: hypoxia-inducible lipid droplet-associated protein [Chrysochloris asiatica]